MTITVEHEPAGESALTRQGCPLHYWITGPADAPVVAFTHGVTMDHRMFDAQVPALARDFRVLRWDVRGHGRSRPLGAGFTIRGAAEDLLAILDHAGVARAALVGHSMGGYIAQELAFLAPGRVSSLCLVGSTCSTWRQPRLVRWGGPLTVPAIRWMPDAVLRPLLGHLGAARGEVRRWATAACRRVPKRDLLPIWRGVIGHFHHEPGYRITQPLLIVHGQRDRIGFGLIPRLAAAWAAHEPQARHVVVPRAGHNANQDEPGYFNRVLLEFLRGGGAEPP